MRLQPPSTCLTQGQSVKILGPRASVMHMTVAGEPFGRPDVDLMFAKWAFNNMPPQRKQIEAIKAKAISKTSLGCCLNTPKTY